MKGKNLSVGKILGILVVVCVLALGVNHFLSIWQVGGEREFYETSESIQFGLGYLMNPADSEWQEGSYGYFLMDSGHAASVANTVVELGNFNQDSYLWGDHPFESSIQTNDGSVPSGQLSILQNYAPLHDRKPFESMLNIDYSINMPPSAGDYYLVVWRCDSAHYGCINPFGVYKDCLHKITRCEVYPRHIKVRKGCDSCTDTELCLLNYVRDDRKQALFQLVDDVGGSVCREETTACLSTEECEQLGIEKSLDFESSGTYVNKEIVHCDRQSISDPILRFVNDNSKSGVAVFGECMLGDAQSPNDCKIAYGEETDFYIVITPTGGSRYQSFGAWAVEDGKCIIGECRNDNNCKLLYGSQGWICRQTPMDVGSTGICDRVCSSHIDCANRINLAEAGFVYGCFNNKCMRADESQVNLVVEGRYICEAYEQLGKINSLAPDHAWYIDNKGDCEQQELYIDQCQTDADCTIKCVAGEKSTCFFSSVHTANLCTPCKEVHFDPTDHCSDGILNYDEERLDCGGVDCPPCTPVTTSTTIPNGDGDGINPYIIFGIIIALAGLSMLIKEVRK